MSALFRGKFLASLTAGKESGAVSAPPDGWPKLWRTIGQTSWNVYCKPPFAGPRQVLAYIANYTYRVALSERRIVTVNEPDGTVTFRWRDYAAKGEVKLCTLPADEFLHRFRRHLLPRGFTKVRHHGLLANNTRRRLIPQARQAIAAGSEKRRDKVGDNSATTTMNSDGVGCSSCGKFNVQCIALVLPSGRRIERRLPLAARVREPP